MARQSRDRCDRLPGVRGVACCQENAQNWRQQVTRQLAHWPYQSRGRGGYPQHAAPATALRSCCISPHLFARGVAMPCFPMSSAYERRARMQAREAAAASASAEELQRCRELVAERAGAEHSATASERGALEQTWLAKWSINGMRPNLRRPRCNAQCHVTQVHAPASSGMEVSTPPKSGERLCILPCHQEDWSSVWPARQINLRAYCF